MLRVKEAAQVVGYGDVLNMRPRSGFGLAVIVVVGLTPQCVAPTTKPLGKVDAHGTMKRWDLDGEGRDVYVFVCRLRLRMWMWVGRSIVQVGGGRTRDEKRIFVR